MKTRSGGWLLALMLATGGVACGGELRVGPESGDGGEAGTAGDGSGTGGDSSGAGGSGGAAGTAGSSGSVGSGNASSGGSGGTGGGSFYPETEFELLPTRVVQKVDLLFVVDNSVSMGEKQDLLRAALPRLFDQLLTPSDYGHGFNPVEDLHVGIISSSLGTMGADVCSLDNSLYHEENDDRGRLLPSVRPDAELNSFAGLGFLAWDPTGDTADAETNPEALLANFQDQLASVGENGCGFEAPLEAWYRFLVDPKPALRTVVEGGVSAPDTSGGEVLVDQELLDQREAFLRPDSAVVIVMLTDENDCSILDRGIGYLTGQAQLESREFHLPAATSACDEDPNSACCRSCGLNESEPPDGCAQLAEDPKCTNGRPAGTDHLNLRCFDQKRRFGLDLLHPVSRYVRGLTRAEVPDTTQCEGFGDEEVCPVVENPLFARDARGVRRDPSHVHLAGIVGVPWQDLATSGSLEGSGLTFKTARRLRQDGVWDLILGNPSTNTPPEDPLMVQSTRPRTGTHPVTGESLGAADSLDPRENSINGHEFNTNDEVLQYACTFPLRSSRDCSADGPVQACECGTTTFEMNKPLCNPPEGGQPETTQYYDAAYPGLRQLEVLRDLGEGAAVASICPKDDASGASGGYNPAMDAVVEALGRSLGPRCLAEALPVDADGRVECTLVEVGASIDCGDPGLREASDDDVDQILEDLESLGVCRGGDCEDLSICEVLQFAGADLAECQESGSIDAEGFCYVDPAQGIGSDALVEACPSGQKRLLRRVGGGPAEDSVLLLRCD